MKTTTLALITLLTPLLAAQDSRPLSPKAAFARAKVLATQEQNPKAALQELDALLRRTDLDAEIRAAVEQEARTLRASIAPLDAEAKRTEAEDRAKAGVAKLRNSDETVGNTGVADLVFLGDAAVSVLASAFPQHEQDRTWTIRASVALARIGTPHAGDAFRTLVRDGDDLRRRAMLEGAASERQGLHTKAMRGAFASFFDLHQPELAVQALRALDRHVLPEQVLELLTTKWFGDGSDEVRAAAAESLARAGQRWDGDWAAHEGAFLKALAEDLANGDDFVLDLLVRQQWAQRHRLGRELALRALAAGLDVRTTSAWESRQLLPEPDESIDLVLEVVKARKGKALGYATTSFLVAFIGKLAEHWTKPNLAKLAEVTTLLEAIQSGTSSYLQLRMVAIASDADFPLVARTAAKIASNSGNLVKWLSQQKAVPDAAVPDLLLLLDEHARKGWTEIDSLCRMVASFGREGDLTELESVRARYPAKVSFSLVGALRQVALSNPTSAVEAALLRYLVAPFEGVPESGMIRNTAFQALAAIGSKAALAAYPVAYRRGLDFSRDTMAPNGRVLRGLGWIVAVPKYSPEELTRLGTELFLPDLEAAWEDLTSNALNPSAVPLMIAALRKLPTCPPGLRQKIANQNVAAWLLTIPGPDWVSRGLDAPLLASLIPLVDNVHSRAALMDRWAIASPEAAHSATLEMLGNPSVNARVTGLGFLSRVDPARAIVELPKLARDANPAVRLEVASIVGDLGREELANVLLELLRDQDATVAKEARESLEKLRFVTEQTRFWNRLQRGTGLDAPSAAEALVQKAKKDQPKATRLLAIDSLGSLAVPETLPFLLELTGEADPEIAARATAAIAKINSAPRREK